MTDQELRIGQRDRLPTREQINQITDLACLEDMKEEVDRRIARIETDLDYRDATVEWENRALSALSVHRYISTAIKRRLEKLSAPKLKKGERQKRTECLALTWMVIDGEFDKEDADTAEELDAKMNTLDEAIEALELDRADENAKHDTRDIAWCVEATAALKRVKAVRHALSLKKAAINRAEKEKRRLEMEGTRERMFIDACREILPKETYQMLWTRVDRQFVEAA